MIEERRGRGRKPNSESHDYSFIIPMLKDHSMTAGQIERAFKKNGQTICINSALNWLTNNSLLYEVSCGVYKILTEKDLDEYEQNYKNGQVIQKTQRGNKNGK